MGGRQFGRDGAVFELGTTVSGWDADYYHPIAQRYYDAAVARMLRLLNAPEDATVLDAGCGPGVHSIRVARTGRRVHAIDLSEAMLAEARGRVADAGVADRVGFERADLTRLHLPDESFDHVFSWGVVIHIPDAEAALAHLARVVRPGGRLALYLTNRRATDHAMEAAGRAFLGRPLALERHPLGPGCWYDLLGERLWVWRFDLPAVSRFLQDRGLVLRHRVIGEWTEIQRRIGGLPRRLLLHANNAAFAVRAPAWTGVTNLLVFEKVA